MVRCSPSFFFFLFRLAVARFATFPLFGGEQRGQAGFVTFGGWIERFAGFGAFGRRQPDRRAVNRHGGRRGRGLGLRGPYTLADGSAVLAPCFVHVTVAATFTARMVQHVGGGARGERQGDENYGEDESSWLSHATSVVR